MDWSIIAASDRLSVVRATRRFFMDNPTHYVFENATFAPREGRLRVDDEDIILEQKVADLLHAFCRRPGQVLTKTWLMEEIWPGRIVNEDSLSVAVSKLRRALGDRAASPKYIRTVTGTGYLWLSDVRRIAAHPENSAATSPPRAGRWRLSALVAAALLTAAIAGWWFNRDRTPPPSPLTPSEEASRGEIDLLLERAEERLSSQQPEALRQAITDFREVLEQHPGSVEAYLGIAEAKLALSATRGYLGIELYADEVHALLDRVLELDPENDRAWLRKAELHWLADWDFPAAERAYKRAIELGPDDPMNYLPCSEFLLALGEFERSEQMLEQMRRADPAWYQFLNMSFVYTMRGELERALAETRRLASSEAESLYHTKMLHRLALLLGMDDMAFDQLVALMRAEGIDETRIAGYTELFHQHGLPALFGHLLDERLDANVGHYVPPIARARYAIVAGRHDEAFRWLGEAVDKRQAQVLFINVDPHYRPLRDDSRFAELLDRLPPGLGESNSSD